MKTLKRIAISLLLLSLVERTQGVDRLASRFAHHAPRIDGELMWGEWDGATRLAFPHGVVSILNDDTRLYLLVNVYGQSQDDTNDDVWLSFDVDGDGAITPGVDLNYALDPATRNLRFQHYTGPGQWDRMAEDTLSAKAEGFDAFLADGSMRVGGRIGGTVSPHRVWELAFNLNEIQTLPGRRIRFGLRVVSPELLIDDEVPPGFSNDFGNLMEIDAAKLGLNLLGGLDPAAVVEFQANGLQVIQAAQTRDNALPLVEHKTTAVRVYLDITGTTKPQPVHVYLHGRRGHFDLPGSPLTQFITVPVSPNAGKFSDRPYFVLPPSWTEGTYELQAQVVHKVSGSRWFGPLYATFTPRQVPTFWIVPLGYAYQGGTNLVDEAEIVRQQNYLKTAFPVPDVNFVRKPPLLFDSSSEDLEDPMPSLNAYYDVTLVGWTLGRMLTGSPPFALPSKIYGFRWYGGGLSDPVWFSGRGKVAWGFRGSSAEGTLAHELNHDLDTNANGTWGRHVPNACGTQGGDPAWPYTGTTIQEAGVSLEDPFFPKALSGSFPDLMGYCHSGFAIGKWLSPYRWANLFNVFAPPAAGSLLQALSVPVASVYYVSGTVFLDGRGLLNPVLLQPGAESGLPPPGDYALNLVDADGALLGSYPFAVSFTDVEGNARDRFHFNFQLAALPGTAAMVLSHGGDTLASIMASPTVPTVQVVQPNGGDVWVGRHTIRWSAHDEDGDPLVFTILYTPDDGLRWFPVAGGITGTSHVVESLHLPGGFSARVRVLATDGFHTVQDDSDETFTVRDKPPVAFVTRPLPDELLIAGEPLRFEAEGEDLEDGPLPDSAFWWRCGTNVFAIGRRVEAVLRAGNQDLSLEIADSEGHAATNPVPSRILMGGVELLVNCGGTEDVTDVLGRVWQPDAPFLAPGHPPTGTFGSESAVQTTLLNDTNVAQEVLMTQRVSDGNMAYEIPVTNGEYGVVLYFSENDPSAVSPSLGGTGGAGDARQFDVEVEGQRVTCNPADAAIAPPGDGRGAVWSAIQLYFVATVQDGSLSLQLEDLGPSNPPGNPAINALRVFDRSAAMLRIGFDPDSALVLRWNARLDGIPQHALQVDGPYHTTNAPARRQDADIVVEIPSESPSSFYRLVFPPPAE